MLGLCRVWICYKSIADLLDAFSLILREIDIEPEVFFEVEDQCILAHYLRGLAVALTLGLTIICSLKHSEVIVYVRLNECLAAAPGFDERFDMPPIVLHGRIALEGELGLPFRFSGWFLIEVWLRLGLILCGHRRLEDGLRLLIAASHLNLRASSPYELPCLVLDSHVCRRPCFTLGLPHLSHFFG